MTVDTLVREKESILAGGHGTVDGDAIQYSGIEPDPNNPYAAGCAWIDGEFVPIADAKISVLDTGFIRSDLTYTVAGVWHGNFFRLKEHLARLYSGAERIRINPPLNVDEVAAAMHRCVALSGLREAYVCVWITRGQSLGGARDANALVPRIHAYAIPFVWLVSPEKQLVGKRAIIARDTRRVSPSSIDPTVKNFMWGDLIRATFEAHDRAADVAFLLDSDGFVTEGPGFNICVVKDGELFTPARGVLHGITRKTVLEIATSLGLAVHVRDVPTVLLEAADEIFTCTTAGGVMPVSYLDGKPVGIGEFSGKPGPATLAIRRRYWELMDSPEYTEPVNYEV